MGKPKAQPVPDPAATAAAQGAANKETAIAQAGLNYVNQNTPAGSQTYKQIGTWSDGTPRYQSDISLSPDQQALYDKQNQFGIGLSDLANSQVGSIQNNLATPFDETGLPAAPKGDQQFVDSAGKALYDQATSRLNPQWAQTEDALRTRLTNQGIVDPNSEAYRTAMANFGRDKNDAYTSASNAATANASQAAQNLFSMGTTARGNAVQEALTRRELPLNEAVALMGGSGGVQMPQFANLPQTGMANTDVIGAYNLANQVGMNNVNAKNAASSSLTGALGGLGGSALMALALSDKRAKRDIRRIGTVRGIGLYTWRYRGEKVTRVGVIAQQVRKRIPAAVRRLPSGLLAVDYNRLNLEGR